MQITICLLVIIILGYLIYYLRFRNVQENRNTVDENVPYEDKHDLTTVPRADGVSPVSLSVSLVTRDRSPDESEADELLKKATSHYEVREYEPAIDCLRRSYKILKASPTSYPISTYTRLPSYLVRSGKYDEGISEAMELLAWIPPRIDRDFSHCKPNQRRGIACSEKAQVYHTMAFLSGLAKKWQNSLGYEIASHAYECLSLKFYPKGQERRSKQSRSAWKEAIDKALKKGNFSAHEQEILDICIAFCNDLSEAGIETLQQQVITVTERPSATMPCV